MLITKRTYKKKYVLEGAGIFESIMNFFARMFSSNAAKQLASAALQAGKLQQMILEWKLFMCDETFAIDAGKKVVEISDKKLSTPRSQVANVMVSPE